MYSNHVSQGQNHHNPPLSASHNGREPVTVVGVPSVTVEHGELIVGNSHSTSTRSYTPLKVVGDGSFGTVWLCDWHGTLPPNTPLSAMQCGAGAKPEYASKRLVAVKRMKRRWEGGWDECKKLKELESLRAIPFHPNIIPLYDFFLLPSSKELYFVFESMEGNLYQLIKSRKGRPLAGGLVSSIFKQTISGLHHIHASGYFHRDMKPENLLVTTTGLYDYTPLSPTAPPNAPPEKDVIVLIKLADFGLARETKSRPPYTEYVSTRWYRAPEVLLHSRDYSNPVDMWALGTIMAELVNLRPLFPGQGEMDQIARICEILGDPSGDYGSDSRGKSVGGGKWSRGIKMARAARFAFPAIQPKDFYALFDRSVPVKLVDCIADLLKYDPDVRLTAEQCLEHPYLLETTPKNHPPILSSSPPPLRSHLQAPFQTSGRNVPPNTQYSTNFKPPLDQRQNTRIHIPNSNLTSLLSSSSPLATHRDTDTGQFPTNDGPVASSSIYSYNNGDRVSQWSDASKNRTTEWDAMDVSSPLPDSVIEEYPVVAGQFMDIQTSPIVQEYHNRPQIDSEPLHDPSIPESQGTKLGKISSLTFGKKPNKWPLSGMFGHTEKHNTLPPVDELHAASSGSTPSLQGTVSSSGSRSLDMDFSPVRENLSRPQDPKKIKKEADRMAREAEKQRRAYAERMHKEQARAVMQKRTQTLMQTDRDDLEWRNTAFLNGRLAIPDHNGKKASSGPIRPNHGHSPGGERSTATLHAAGGRYGETTFASWRDNERSAKARRRDHDDDHSMSSSELASVGRMSVISSATVDSDPGPTRLRSRSSMFGMNSKTSSSSLRTSFDDFPKSARSSNSLSLEQQLVNEFHIRASLDSSLSDHGSPPPMQRLSLGSPQWRHQNVKSRDGNILQASMDLNPSSFMSLPSVPRHSRHPPKSRSLSPYETVAEYPPSPGVAPKSAVNPIFQVPLNYPASQDGRPTSTSLPPFSHLEAVADGDYPPLSPMAFKPPEAEETAVLDNS